MDILKAMDTTALDTTVMDITAKGTMAIDNTITVTDIADSK